MGILVEFNPDLALRDFRECEEGRRRAEECIPKDLHEGETYRFLKSGHRNYYFLGEIPLVQTKGEGVLSKPLASVAMLEATHFMKDEKPYTKGMYRVVEVFHDDKIHFNGLERVR